MRVIRYSKYGQRMIGFSVDRVNAPSYYRYSMWVAIWWVGIIHDFTPHDKEKQNDNN